MIRRTGAALLFSSPPSAEPLSAALATCFALRAEVTGIEKEGVKVSGHEEEGGIRSAS